MMSSTQYVTAKIETRYVVSTVNSTALIDVIVKNNAAVNVNVRVTLYDARTGDVLFDKTYSLPGGEHTIVVSTPSYSDVGRHYYRLVVYSEADEKNVLDTYIIHAVIPQELSICTESVYNKNEFNAYVDLIECAKLVYKRLVNSYVFGVLSKVFPTLADKAISRLVENNEIVAKILEAPNELLVMSKPDQYLGSLQHRQLPLPVLSFISPMASDIELPIMIGFTKVARVRARYWDVVVNDIIKDLVHARPKLVLWIKEWNSDDYEAVQAKFEEFGVIERVYDYNFNEIYHPEGYVPSTPLSIKCRGYAYRRTKGTYDIEVLLCDEIWFKDQSNRWISVGRGIIVDVDQNDATIDRLKVRDIELRLYKQVDSEIRFAKKMIVIHAVSFYAYYDEWISPSTPISPPTEPRYPY